THRLAGTLHGTMPIAWALAVRPIHDWAVEAIFDRLEEALRTGAPPPVTTSPMPAHARLAYAALERRGHGALSRPARRAPGNWGATAEEMQLGHACDALVVPADARFFRAVTVNAPAATVYRWLCQLRAAPYSYDWID